MLDDEDQEEVDVEKHQNQDGELKEEEGLVASVADEAVHLANASLK